MGIDCDFFIISNIYTNIFNRIKKDIINGTFPHCQNREQPCNITYKDAYCNIIQNDLQSDLRYKLELCKQVEIENSDCIYLTLSEWVYTHNGQMTRIIHISCGCRYNKVSGPYTINEMKNYFHNFNLIKLYCMGDVDIEQFIQFIKK